MSKIGESTHEDQVEVDAVGVQYPKPDQITSVIVSLSCPFWEMLSLFSLCLLQRFEIHKNKEESRAKFSEHIKQ